MKAQCLAITVIAVLFGMAALTDAAGAGPLVASSALQAEGDSSGATLETYYTCPMHPSVRKPGPGACPVCGMTLVKKTVARSDETPPSSGLESVHLSPGRQVLANIGVSAARREKIRPAIHAYGMITAAQPQQTLLTMRFPGRADRVYIASEGTRVRAGDPIVAVYSPEILSALANYRLSLADSGGASSEADFFAAHTRSLVDESRRRLELLGLSREEIEKNLSSPEDSLVVIVAPHEGVVTRKEVLPGQYLNAGDLVAEISGNAELWLEAQVYEYESAQVHVGTTLRATFDAHPGLEIQAGISFVSQVVDPESRTITVRAPIENRRGDLRAGEFATVTLEPPAVEALAVPKSAVFSTGRSAVVWVEEQAHLFVPRRIRTGVDDGENVQVLSGLKEGDSVVTEGGYLLDAESHLNLPKAP